MWLWRQTRTGGSQTRTEAATKQNRRQPNENRGGGQMRTEAVAKREQAAAEREQRRRPNKNRGGKTRTETRGEEAMAAMRREEEGAEAAKIQLNKT